MDHVETLRTFIAVAEAGSLSAGAKRRDISGPATTRAIAALERRLGTPLLLRTTRSMRLTEVGERLLVDARRIVADLDAVEASITGAQVQVQGLLSVTAPELFGQRHIAPLLFEFLDRHPGLQARACFANRLVHLIDEGFDVALRIAPLPDSGLTAVPIGHLRTVLVASRAEAGPRASGVPGRACGIRQGQGLRAVRGRTAARTARAEGGRVGTVGPPVPESPAS